MKKTNILFVCLGNICRSPSAEAIMKKLIEQRGLQDKYFIDSAGIIGFHSGEPADMRMRKHAEKRGYTITSLARQFNPNSDYKNFDLIIGMDKRNMKDLRSLTVVDNYLRKLHIMTEYCKIFKEDGIPDPYYGGHDGFEYVLDLLEDACSQLLNELEDL